MGALKNTSILLGLAIALSGCGADPLSKLLGKPAAQAQLDVSTSKVNFHSIDPEFVGNKTKFLFIIDKSASNYFGGVNEQEPQKGNDVDGSRRFTPILNFVDKQRQKKTSNNYFGVIFFNSFCENSPDCPADDYAVKVGSDFTNNYDSFKQVVMLQKPLANGDAAPGGDEDRDSTDFIQALDQARRLIDKDITATAQDTDPGTTTYVIFHISDGKPDPVLRNGQDYQQPYQIKSSVEAILNLQSGAGQKVSGIYLHTGYYFNGTADPSADSLMKQMAQWGRGQALQFGNGSAVDFSQFETPADSIQMKLVDVFMTNVNTVWETNSNGDPELKLDSDGDGLSDELELRLGSNPYAVDSDGNGVSDFVEYRKNGRPCRGASCSKDFAVVYNGCSDIARVAPDGTISYPDTDGDGLNDCEERLLGTLESRWDSNGDWINDWMGLRAGIAILPGANEAALDPDQDGIDNYNEVKLNTPTYKDNRKLLSIPVYDYTLRVSGSDADGTLYGIDIRNIPTVGPKEKNHLRVVVLERLDNTRDLRFMRVAEKALNPDGSVTIGDGDFGDPFRQCNDSGCQAK